MSIAEWLQVIGWIFTTIVALVGAYPVVMRLRSQNNKDSVDALKVALEMVGQDVTEQLELRKTVQHLQEIMEKRRYKISVIFKLGEKPIIEEASIEMYEIPNPNTSTYTTTPSST